MKKSENLPRGNWTPFTREDLVKFGQELKESGKCPVQDPNFYKPWKFFTVGTQEYEDELLRVEPQRRERTKLRRLLTKKRK
jgi:hypothetical protein